MRWLLIPLIVAQGVSFRCATSPGLPGIELLQLKVGETKQQQGLAVTFEAVVNDWRCPTTVTCVQFGDVEARFVVRSRTAKATHLLRLHDPNLRQADTIEQATITFETLAPLPFSTEPVAQHRYIANVRLVRR